MLCTIQSWMMSGLSEILKEWCTRPPATSTCMCLPNFQLKFRLQDEVSNAGCLIESYFQLTPCYAKQSNLIDFKAE